MEQQVKNHNAASNLFKSLAAAERFSSELNSQIRSGSFATLEHTLLVRKVIAGEAGSVDFIDANTRKLNGISNIVENKLPKNAAFLARGVVISYGVGDETAIGAEALETALPGALKNATLKVEQGSSVIMERPISDFVSKGTATSPAENILELASPAVLRDDEPMTWKIIYPEGATVSAGTAGSKAIAEIKFLGYTTRRKIS